MKPPRNFLKNLRSFSAFSHKTLEPRRVLNASFAYDGLVLDLDDFVDSGAGAELVTVEQSGTDYIFTLSDGVWSGTDTSGALGTLSGTGTAILTISDPANNLTAITLTDNTADTYDINFGDFSFGGTFDVVASTGQFANITQTGTTSVQFSNTLTIVADSIDLQESGNDFSTVSITNAVTTSLLETNDIVLGDMDNSGALTVESTGGNITDGSSITVTGDATFTATGSITLNDSVGDILSVGGKASFSGSSIDVGSDGTFNAATLNFNSAGAVTIQEDSGTDICLSNTASTLSITSSGAITDSAATSIVTTSDATFTATGAVTLNDNGTDTLTVGGGATFSGTSISVGSAGTFNADSINFNSAGVVTIQEDSATVVGASNTASTLDLTSAGSITDLAAASIVTTGDATFTATGAVTLNDNGTDTLTVGGKAAFSGSSIAIGPAGTFNADSINFNSAGTVTIQEDSDTVICLSNTASVLSLSSAGSITDLAATSVVTTGDATFTATTFVTLNDNGTDTLTVGGKAAFDGTAIAIGAAGTFNADSINFNSAGTVTIQEDSDMVVCLSNTASVLSLSSAGSITDLAATSIVTTGDATFTPTTSVTLNDNGTDTLTVGGKATFTGTSIAIGAAGTFNADSINFNSAGTVTIQEDSAMVICLSNTASVLTLTSAGSITELAATSVVTTGDATFFATGAVTLNDNGTDTLTVGGKASFSGSSIAVGAAGTFNADSINFNSAGTVTIQEDSDTVICLSNTASVLSLSSAGSITDLAATSVVTTGDATFTPTTFVTLNDNGTDTLTVGGKATFTGTTIAIGAAGTFNADSINFNSAGTVTIQEDSAMVICLSNTASVLTLTSAGSITELAATSVVTTGDATFSATGAVTLNDNGTDTLTVAGKASFGGSSIAVGAAGTFNADSINFNSAGTVTIQEDSDTVICLSNTASVLSLSSAGSITDLAATSVVTTGDATFTPTTFVTLNDNGTDTLTVGGKATFSGMTIAIGAAGTFNADSINFNSAGTVTIQEDSDMVICLSNTASVLDLSSTGSITDLAATSVVTTGDATFTATGAITLNNAGTDTLTVAGKATFSGASIAVGAAGTFNADSINFNSAGTVTIQEDSDMVVCLTNTASVLSLSSAGSITELAGVSIVTTGDATFAATTTVTLADNAADILTVGGKAAFSGTTIAVGPAGAFNAASVNFNSAGTVTIQEDSDMVLCLSNTASVLDLTSAGSITDLAGTSVVTTGDATFTPTTFVTLNDNGADTLTVGGKATFTGTSIAVGAAGTFNADSINFNSAGTVTIQEDSDMVVCLTNTASVLLLSSTGSITELAGVSIVTTSDATFAATGAVTLNDNAADVLTVGGKAAFSGSSVAVGAAGTFNAASVNFNSAGTVTIQEDSDMVICLSNTASVLTLNSAGSITDLAGTSVVTTGDATFTPTTFVTLNDNGTDTLTVGGKATFTGTTIAVGAAGTFNADSINFNTAGTVTIQEDSDMVICLSNTASVLSLSSTGSITDLAATSVVTTSDATFTATGAITLNDTGTDVLTVTGKAAFSGASVAVGSAGAFNAVTVNFTSGGAVSIQEDSDMVLCLANTAGSLDLASTGSITQLAGSTVTVTGTTALLATDEICLTESNDFGGAVSGMADTVEIVDRNALIAGDITAVNDIRLTSGNGLLVVETGALTLVGDLTTTAADGQVLLQSDAGVAQSSATSVITTNDLLVGGDIADEGSGLFALVGSNVVNRLAGNLLGGSLQFVNTAALVVTELDYSSVCGTMESILGLHAATADTVDAAFETASSIDTGDADGLTTSFVTANELYNDNFATYVNTGSLGIAIVNEGNFVNMAGVSAGSGTISASTGDVYIETQASGTLTIREDVSVASPARNITLFAGGDYSIVNGAQLTRGAAAGVFFTNTTFVDVLNEFANSPVNPATNSQIVDLAYGGFQGFDVEREFDVNVFWGIKGQVDVTVNVDFNGLNAALLSQIMGHVTTQEFDVFYDRNISTLSDVLSSDAAGDQFSNVFQDLFPEFANIAMVFNDAQINVFENASSDLIDLNVAAQDFRGTNLDALPVLPVVAPPPEVPVFNVSVTPPSAIDPINDVEVITEEAPIQTGRQPESFYLVRFSEDNDGTYEGQFEWIGDEDIEAIRTKLESAQLIEGSEDWTAEDWERALKEGKIKPGLYYLFEVQEGDTSEQPVDEIIDRTDIENVVDSETDPEANDANQNPSSEDESPADQELDPAQAPQDGLPEDGEAQADQDDASVSETKPLVPFAQEQANHRFSPTTNRMLLGSSLLLACSTRASNRSQERETIEKINRLANEEESFFSRSARLKRKSVRAGDSSLTHRS